MIRASFLTLFALLSINTSAQELSAYLVRHAEKVTQEGNNPALTSRGERRAARYVTLFEHVPVAAIYSTDTLRTRSTAAPLAAAKNLRIQLYQAGTLDRQTLLEKHSGEAIFIVGHSNTIPNTVNRLIEREQTAEIDEKQYDDFFIVRLNQSGESTVAHLMLPLSQ